MYKRLKIKVEEEERRREKEVSFGVLEKNTAQAAVQAVTTKRKIPSFKEILSKTDEKVKRKLVPVKPWDTSNINSVYLLKSVHEMEISLTSGKKNSLLQLCQR